MEGNVTLAIGNTSIEVTTGDSSQDMKAPLIIATKQGDKYHH